MKDHTPGIYWISGLSGSGKTTLSTAAAARLADLGYSCLVLDGDTLRRGLCADLGYSQADREENIQRAGEVARIAASQGHVCLCAFITPYEAMRTRLRASLGPLYHEIYLDCPLGVCMERDPKHNYAKAKQGALPNYTGIDAPYEPPSAPDLRLDTSRLALDACIETIVNFIKHTASRQQPGND